MPNEVLDVTPDDVFVGSPPLAFTFGLGGLAVFPLRFGAAATLLENASPPNMVDIIQTYKATVCFTAPTAYRAMLAAMDEGADLSSLRAAVSAGETLPAPVYEAWMQRTGKPMLDGIGATEMLHIFISNRFGDSKPACTGTPVRGYQAKVVDDDMHEVPRNTVGRLAVRGPTGCRYLADDRQRVYVRDGWNLTGDSFVQDDDGYFHFAARSDDMIISAGYNIAGPEVEATLLAHPHVVECAVIGVRRRVAWSDRASARGARRRRRCLGGDGRDAAGAREGGDRAVQVPALDRVHRCPAEDADRQDPTLPPPPGAVTGSRPADETIRQGSAMNECPQSGHSRSSMRAPAMSPLSEYVGTPHFGQSRAFNRRARGTGREQDLLDLGKIKTPIAAGRHRDRQAVHQHVPAVLRGVAVAASRLHELQALSVSHPAEPVLDHLVVGGQQRAQLVRASLCLTLHRPRLIGIGPLACPRHRLPGGAPTLPRGLYRTGRGGRPRPATAREVPALTGIDLVRINSAL